MQKEMIAEKANNQETIAVVSEVKEVSSVNAVAPEGRLSPEIEELVRSRDCLTKGVFSELKALNNPPFEVYALMKMFATLAGGAHLSKFSEVRRYFQNPFNCVMIVTSIDLSSFSKELAAQLQSSLEGSGEFIRKKSQPAYLLYRWLRALEAVLVARGTLEKVSAPISEHDEQVVDSKQRYLTLTQTRN